MMVGQAEGKKEESSYKVDSAGANKHRCRQVETL